MARSPIVVCCLRDSAIRRAATICPVVRITAFVFENKDKAFEESAHFGTLFNHSHKPTVTSPASHSIFDTKPLPIS